MSLKPASCAFIILSAALICNGETQKSKSPAQVAEGPYIIRFSYAPLDMSPREAETWWGGGFDVKHYNVLTRISGTYKGKPLRVARSAWAGIAVIDAARIVPLDNGCEVLISGADAGGAYQMELTFQGPDLIYRKVRLGEFPDDMWEQTFYKYIHLMT